MYIYIYIYTHTYRPCQRAGRGPAGAGDPGGRGGRRGPP